MDEIVCSSPREQIEREGFHCSSVVGFSMTPMLRQKRDTIYIEKCDEYKKFDVALFVMPTGKYILHRLIKIKGDVYIFRGDHCITYERVKKEQILGKLTKFWRDEKEVICDKNFGYKCYVVFWYCTYPVRYLFAKTKQLLKKIFKRQK